MRHRRGETFVILSITAMGALFVIVGLLSDEREWATVTGGVVLLFALAAWIAVRRNRADDGA